MDDIGQVIHLYIYMGWIARGSNSRSIMFATIDDACQDRDRPAAAVEDLTRWSMHDNIFFILIFFLNIFFNRIWEPAFSSCVSGACLHACLHGTPNNIHRQRNHFPLSLKYIIKHWLYNQFFLNGFIISYLVGLVNGRLSGSYGNPDRATNWCHLPTSLRLKLNHQLAIYDHLHDHILYSS